MGIRPGGLEQPGISGRKGQDFFVAVVVAGVGIEHLKAVHGLGLGDALAVPQGVSLNDRNAMGFGDGVKRLDGHIKDPRQRQKEGPIRPVEQIVVGAQRQLRRA